MWNQHCKACHEDHKWRGERERVKTLGLEVALAPLAASAASAAPATMNSSRAVGSAPPPAEFSVRKLLEKVTTVHPVEISPPAGSGFTTALRHYQKQSLAFMVDVERASAADNEKMPGGWLADEVGMGKVCL